MFEITYSDKETFEAYQNAGKAYKKGVYDFTFEHRYIIYHANLRNKVDYIAIDMTTGLASCVITKQPGNLYTEVSYRRLIPHILYTNYVQALINPHTKILALRPCGEGERGSFQWCSMSQGKRKPRQTTCTLFFLKMFDMMNWNPDHRYKMLGNIIRANGEYLIAFDLTSTEVYQRTYDEEGAKSTASRTPVYPIGWQNQFGMTFNEHKQSMLVNIFEGYAIYSIKENKAVRQTSTASDAAGQLALPEGGTNSERKDSPTGNHIG